MADTDYTIALGVTGADEVLAASATLQRLQAELEGASSASTSAASAVAEAQAKYNQLEVAADRAAKALEKAVAAGASADKIADLGAKSDAAAAGLRSQASALDELRAASVKADAAEKKLVDDIDAATKAQKKAQGAHDAAKKALPTGKVNELAEAFGKLPGPLGDVGQKIFGTADGLRKMGGAAGGSFTLLASGAAIALAAVVALGAGLFAATKQIIEWADKDDRLGKAQDKLAKNLKATFGGAVKVDKFLDGMDTLVNLFDKSTASGRALQFITNAIFQPLIDGATAAIPLIERAFLIAEIWALKAYIAVKKFSDSPIGQALITGLEIVAVLFGAILAVVAIAAIMLALPFVLAAAAVVAVIAVIGALVDWLSGALPAAWDAVSGAASAAWDAVKGAVQGALDWLSSLDLVSIGTDMIMGLVNGIAGAAGAVVSAITGAVGGAIDAAKSLLGIASPSKVFAEIGQNTGEGMTRGVDASAGDVQSSMTNMVDPTAAASAAGAIGGGKGGTYQITINAPSGKADDIATAVRNVLIDISEGNLTQLSPVPA